MQLGTEYLSESRLKNLSRQPGSIVYCPKSGKAILSIMPRVVTERFLLLIKCANICISSANK